MIDNVDGIPNNAIEVFVGSLHAIVLTHRGTSDNHILINLYTVTDNSNGRVKLVPSRGNLCVSSSWTPDLINILTMAQNWMMLNAYPDISSDHGKMYGWTTDKR